MNKYESVIIINPNVDEEKVKKLEDTFTNLINKNGNDIKKNKEGIYVTFYFEASPDLIAELERNYRITDEIMKFIVVREEE